MAEKPELPMIRIPGCAPVEIVPVVMLDIPDGDPVVLRWDACRGLFVGTYHENEVTFGSKPINRERKP
jgi:hypothetical protein